ncbi:MAG: hypothetical protein QM688_06615 [Sphingomonas bacterium]
MKKIVLLGALAALGMLSAGVASAEDYPPCSASVRDNCVQGARSATHHARATRHHATKHHVKARKGKHHVKTHHAKTHHKVRHHRVHKR